MSCCPKTRKRSRRKNGVSGGCGRTLSAAVTGPLQPGTFSGVRTLALCRYLKHGRVRFVIALTSNDGTMRFRLLEAIGSEL